jgi:hypothetical protein
LSINPLPRGWHCQAYSAPCFPSGWDEARIDNFKFGDRRLSLTIRRKADT